MTPEPPPVPGSVRPELPSAAPSTGARLLAVAAIVVAGICGGLIGFALFDLEVSGQEGAGSGGSGAGGAIGALVGAVVAAVGVAIVAVLVLRAMTEWQTIEERAAAAGREPPRPGRRRS